MPDELRSPSSTIWCRTGSTRIKGIRRFYSLMTERDLFGTVRLMRIGGRIGTTGQELVGIFAGELEAGEALEAIAHAKRQRDYEDL